MKFKVGDIVKQNIRGGVEIFRITELLDSNNCKCDLIAIPQSHRFEINFSHNWNIYSNAELHPMSNTTLGRLIYGN